MEKTIPESSIARVNEALAKINRKADKLGVPPFAVTYSAPRVHKVQKPGESYDIMVVDATVSGEPVRVGGYRFLSRIDFEGGLILLNTRPGETLPERFRAATPMCMHCASERKRKQVFVLRREGDDQHVQVGSTCLRDFLGHDPAAMLGAVSLWNDLEACFDSEGDYSSGGRVDHVVSVHLALTIATAVVRACNGDFVSRAAADAAEARGRYIETTSSMVFDQLFPPKPLPHDWKRLPITDDDEAQATVAIAWGKAMPGASEYESNMLQLLSVDHIRLKRLGLLVSLIGGYRRYLGEVAERIALVNGYVGTVGKRTEFEAVFGGLKSFPTDYGMLYIARFNTPNGQLVYRGTSPFWPDSINPGDSLRFKATIKAHEEYKGFCQTHIQRVALLESAAA